MERIVECPNCGTEKAIQYSVLAWQCPACKAWIKGTPGRPVVQKDETND